MPNKLAPIWTAEGQAQRAAKRKPGVKLTPKRIREALRKFGGAK